MKLAREEIPLHNACRYVARDGAEAVPKSLNLFQIFSEQVALIIGARVKMDPQDCVAMQVSLINLAIKCYPSELGYVVVSVILEWCSDPGGGGALIRYSTWFPFFVFIQLWQCSEIDGKKELREEYTVCTFRSSVCVRLAACI
jgi:hypothetical protein